MKAIIACFLVASALLTGCQLFQKSSDRYSYAEPNQPLRAPSGDFCQDHPTYPPLVTVLENNQKQITLELGPIGSFFNFTGLAYEYKVTFRGSKETKDDQEVLVLRGESHEAKHRVQIPVQKTGVYYLTVFENEDSPVWKQKVFAIAEREHQLSDTEKSELAQKYAPVVSYHPQELYYPVSLEYLTNQVDVDNELNEEPFRLTNKKITNSFFSFLSRPTLDLSFKFSELMQILPYYGHAESVLKSGLSDSTQTRLKKRYGKNHATVYYSVFENPKYKEIYINYHFFYSFDPKNGTEDNDALAAHIFDRESMTVVLRSTSKEPLSVFYGAHLASQTMGQVSEDDGRILQQWKTGRVFVNWRDVNKIDGRPVPAIALGSHGVYPKKGRYSVFLTDKIAVLTEPAGGDKLLYPAVSSVEPSTGAAVVSDSASTYQLKDLGLDQVTSDCKRVESLLSFSGSTVDVLGPTNATFPPFTDREEDYQSYADPNAPMFEMNLQ